MHTLSPSTIDLADPRVQRAIPIAADAGQWARVVDRHTGAVYFGISSSKPNVRYLTDSSSYACKDAAFHTWGDCKYVLAVRIREDARIDHFDQVADRALAWLER
jgi:hypothetical protein